MSDPTPSPSSSRDVVETTIDADLSTYTSGSYLIVAELTDVSGGEASPTSLASAAASGSGGKKLGLLEIIAIFVGGAALLVAIALAMYFLIARMRRRRREAAFEARYGKGIQHVYNHSNPSSSERAPSRLATPSTPRSRPSSNSQPNARYSRNRSTTPNTPSSAFAKLAAEESRTMELEEMPGEEHTVFTYEDGKRAKEDMWKAAGYSGSPKIPPLPSLAPSVRSARSKPGETDRGSVTGSEASPTSATTSRRAPGRREMGKGTDTVVLPSYYYPSA